MQMEMEAKDIKDAVSVSDNNRKPRVKHSQEMTWWVTVLNSHFLIKKHGLY